MMRRRRWVMMVTAALVICQVAAAAPAAELAGAKSGAPRTDEEGLGGAFYGFTVGLVKGIGLGAVRTAVGAYELLTFPIPANDYEPVVLPAYPFEPGPTEMFPDAP